MGRLPADPSSYQTDQHRPTAPDISHSQHQTYSAHVQEPSYYQEQQYPQGFGPQSDHPPPPYPPPPPTTHQPVQFPPPQSQNPNLHPAGPYSYPLQGQGNPANQPTQFPPPSSWQTNPIYSNQNPGPYPPPQYIPVMPTQPQPVQFPHHNPATGYNMSSTQQPNYNIAPAAAGIPLSQQPAQVFNQRWKTGLFDCMDDPGNALVTACFPCVTFGQIAEIIDNGQTSCLSNGLVYGLIASVIYFPCIVSCSYRTKLRAKYGLIEDPAPDWLTHFLFEWCALCQEYRELQHRGFNPAIGWHANVQNQVRQQQPQVAMTPPMNQSMRP